MCTTCVRMWCLDCYPSGCPWPHAMPMPVPTSSIQYELEDTPTPTKKPRTIKVPNIPVPADLRPWVDYVRSQGGIMQSIAPADRRQYLKGAYEIHVTVPAGITPLNTHDLSTFDAQSGRRTITMTKQTVKKETRYWFVIA